MVELLSEGTHWVPYALDKPPMGDAGWVIRAGEKYRFGEAPGSVASYAGEWRRAEDSSIEILVRGFDKNMRFFCERKMGPFLPRNRERPRSL